MKKLHLEPEPRIVELSGILEKLKQNQIECQEQAEELPNYDELVS